MQPLSQEYLLSVCEVKTLENDFLMTGVITQITDDYLQLGSYRDDRLPLVQFDKPVKILIHNLKAGFRVVAGTAYLSTDKMLRVVGVESLQDFERRGFFRVPARLAGKVMLKNPNTTEFSDDLDVSIENISLSGFLFSFSQQDKSLSIGDTLLLVLKLPTGMMQISCRVRRTECWDTKRPRYGCEFFDYTQKDADKLCFYIFELQRDMIRKKKKL